MKLEEVLMILGDKIVMIYERDKIIQDQKKQIEALKEAIREIQTNG